MTQPLRVEPPRPRTLGERPLPAERPAAQRPAPLRKVPPSAQNRASDAVRLLARSLEQSAMLAWARRGELRAVSAMPAATRHASEDALHDGVRPLRFLSFNIQVGIATARFRHYLTRGWKHVLPHEGRTLNLQRIADVVQEYDVVALQEIDSGSLRSSYVNQVQYIAERARFPYWYTQLNRDLGPLAQHGNGLLSRVAPMEMQDHKLPGAIPGRGAIVARLPYGDTSVLVVLLHLSLGERSRRMQLEYVKRLIDGEPHVLLMGDMNSHLSQLLFDSPLAETELRPVGQVLPTYPAWRPLHALDHVLVSPSLIMRDYEVLDCRLSDHRPIAVTLEMSRQPAAVL
jgi:endonuclease/exonuclease/phosphatase family metal-dependent hydrolase